MAAHDTAGQIKEQLDRIEAKQALIGVILLAYASNRPRRKSLTDKFLDLDWLP